MSVNRLLVLSITIPLLSALLAGCTGSGGSNDGAVKAVEMYIQALADKNGNEMIASSCAAWEEQAQLELDAFVGVQTRVENMTCQVTGTEEETTLVSCTGQIVATYGAEDRDFPLDTAAFKVVQEGGEWRVCGR